MKVLHVIVGLDVGGAELMLKRLIESVPASISAVVVVSLTSLGAIGEALRKQGTKVHALGMSSLLDIPIVLWRLVRLIRQYRPKVVQTWMYHADLLGGLAARLVGSCVVVWGIRSTTIPQGPLSPTYWLVRLCAVCSHFIPHRIICCAHSAREVHVKLGYKSGRMTVIPNGYSLSVFERHSNSRAAARVELGFGADDVVIGVVGRFDPIKDFRNFVRAASDLIAQRGNVRVLMIGRKIDWSNIALRAWIEDGGAAKNFRLVGEHLDVPYYLAAMDIFCMSSVCGEAFPNALVEAMAMGLPCVVTRVGDAAMILDDNEFVVPVKDSAALSDALMRMCDLNSGARSALGQRGAVKVRAAYDIKHIRQRYDDLYAEIAN